MGSNRSLPTAQNGSPRSTSPRSFVSSRSAPTKSPAHCLLSRARPVRPLRIPAHPFAYGRSGGVHDAELPPPVGRTLAVKGGRSRPSLRREAPLTASAVRTPCTPPHPALTGTTRPADRPGMLGSVAQAAPIGCRPKTTLVLCRRDGSTHLLHASRRAHLRARRGAPAERRVRALSAA